MGSDNRAATNQATPLIGHDVVTSDSRLVDAIRRSGSDGAIASLDHVGAGPELAMVAERATPVVSL